MTTQTFTINKAQAFYVPFIMEKLAKIAKKLNVPAPSFSLARFENFNELELTFPAELKIGEFTLIAVIDDLGTGYIIKKVDFSVEGIEVKPNTCEHCNRARSRKRYFVISPDGGETLVQVGSSCLKDYLGHADAVDVLRMIAMLAEPEPDEEFFGSARSKFFLTLETVEMAVAAIEKLGFHKSRNAGSDTWSTAATVLANLTNDIKALKDQPQYMIDVKPEHSAKAIELIEWAREMETSNDYLSNLQTLAKAEYFDRRKYMGLVVSLPQAKANQGRFEEKQAEYKAQAETRAAERAERAAQTRYLGNIGERLTFTATVKDQRFFDSDFGGSFLVTFETEDGDALSSFVSASAKFLDYVAKGATLTFKGTVKNHKEFGGIKQTQLSRLSIEHPPFNKAADYVEFHLQCENLEPIRTKAYDEIRKLENAETDEARAIKHWEYIIDHIGSSVYHQNKVEKIRLNLEELKRIGAA